MKCLMKWLLAGAMMVGSWLTGATTVRAETEVVGGVTWGYTVSNGVATVTNANPTSGNLVIPSSLGGVPVGVIGKGAFKNTYDLWTVSIPDSVTDIGEEAFANCYFFEADVDSGLYYVGLTELTIGNGVTNIGAKAFQGCGLLSEVSWGKVVSVPIDLRSCSGVTCRSSMPRTT